LCRVVIVLAADGIQGIVKHGYGNWDEICEDPSLAFHCLVEKAREKQRLEEKQKPEEAEKPKVRAPYRARGISSLKSFAGRRDGRKEGRRGRTHGGGR
jgi:hypothetical protein